MIAPSTKAPEMDLEPLDIEDLLDELREHHAIYSPLFRRREQQEWAEKYTHGLALDIPRKAIEPMVLTLEGADPNAVRGMQHFISEGAWDDVVILERHWQEVDKDLGDEDGVFILDGSGFAKQGSESVGVKHQYCGELGKVANCQVGVFLGYASEKGHTLLDRRLYLPKEWVKDEEFAERREKCGVPEEIEFGTKPELGWEMVERLYEKGNLRGPVVTAHPVLRTHRTQCRTYRRWLACATVYGQDPDFLDKVANETDLWYYAEVPCDTRAWLERPATEMPE